MAESPGGTKKSLAQTMTEINLGYGQGMNQNKPPMGKPSEILAETVREQMAFQQAQDMQEDLAFQRERKMVERAKEKAAMLNQSAAKPAEPSPMNELLKGFSNPEFLKEWATLSPENQQMLLMTASSQSGGAKGGTDPMMMLMMMQMMRQPQQAQGVGVKDIAEIFKVGAESVKNSIPQTPPPSDPIATFTAITNALKPFQDQANSAAEKSFTAQIEALKGQNNKAATLKETIGDLKGVIDMFGGGGTGAADIEMARINAQTNMQMAQLQMQFKQMEMEAASQAVNKELLGGIASSAISAVGPAIAGGVKDMAMKQAQQHPQPGGAAQNMQTQQQQQEYPGSSVQVSCPECHKMTMYQGIDMADPPKELECGHCGEKYPMKWK